MKDFTYFRLNGRPVILSVEPERPLLWVLRTDIGVTGPKFGCGQALCGACTVLVDGEAVRACTTPVASVQGKTVTTIEGLARDGELHPLQRAFVEHDALQCGFCTPGMIMSAYSLLRRNPHPSHDEILAYMDGNLCRCGSHNRVVRAVRAASQDMEGGRP